MTTMRDATAALFAAAEAGHFTLPPRLIKMRAGLTALQETVDPVLRTEADEHGDLVAATAAAAVGPSRSRTSPPSRPPDSKSVSPRTASTCESKPLRL